MNYSVLERSPLFRGLSAAEVRAILKETPHRVQHFDKGEVIFHLLDEACKVGIVLEGRVGGQKLFPDGSQINVFVRRQGELGSIAAFSELQQYPYDIVSLDPSVMLFIMKADLLNLMQRNRKVLENFTALNASIAYQFEFRMELLAHNGIVKKAAFYLLTQAQLTGKNVVPIPDSMSKWAILMNVSRTSLHRELRRLETQGMIEYAPPVIRILDPTALQEVLSRSRE